MNGNQKIVYRNQEMEEKVRELETRVIELGGGV